MCLLFPELGRCRFKYHLHYSRKWASGGVQKFQASWVCFVVELNVVLVHIMDIWFRDLGLYSLYCIYLVVE